MKMKAWPSLLCLLTTLWSVSPGHAQLFQQIHLDCGGYLSGIHAHSSGRLYAFGDTFGAFRSDNSGTTWKYLLGDITSSENAGRSIVCAKNTVDTVYYLNHSSVWKSTNGGATWTRVLTGLVSNPSLNRGGSMLAINPSNDNEIWVANATGVTGGLSRSQDGGTIWTKMGGTTFDGKHVNAIMQRAAFPSQVWVGANDGLYVSNNSGTSFTRVWNNGGTNPGVGSVVSALPAQSNKVFFGTGNGAWRITATDWNNTATYTYTMVALGGRAVNPTVLADGSVVVSRNQSDMVLLTNNEATTTTMPRTLLSTAVPIWTTATAIQTQGTLGYGTDKIVQDPLTPSRWYTTGGFSPHVSANAGQSWVYNSTGLAGVMTKKACFSKNDASKVFIPCEDIGLAMVTDGGVSTNASSTSYRFTRSLQTYHDVMEYNSGQTIILAGTSQGDSRNIIIKSTDYGNTWAEINLASSGLPLSTEGITRAVMSATNVNDFLVMLGSGGANNNPGVWRTTNGGTNFTKVVGIPDGLSTGSRTHQENSYLLRDGVNTNVRYAAFRNTGSALGGFYRSSDNGANWARLSTQPIGNDYIWGMAADPATAGRVWVAGGYRGLHTSTNGGDSWTQNTYFTGAGTSVDRVDAANGRVAVWGKRGGDAHAKLYYSPDNGTTWSELTTTGHRYPFTSEIAVDPWRAGQVWISGVSVNVYKPCLNYEGESLTVLASSGDTVRTYAQTGLSANNASIIDANAIGDYVTYQVNVPEARPYKVYVRTKTFTNRGVFQLAIAGATPSFTNHGAPVSQYATTEQFIEQEVVGALPGFGSAGNKQFRFTVNALGAGNGAAISVDAIRLVPQ
jgi:Sortilin, neurotensin receptor 3,